MHSTARLLQSAMGLPFPVISVILLWSISSLGDAKEFGCKGITPDKDREELLNFHNEYRANLTKGVQIKFSKLPPAKNMYELEWDCDMEAKAEHAMNMSCKDMARRFYNTYGHSLGKWALCEKFNKPVEEYGIPGVMEEWWSEGAGFDVVHRRYTTFRATNFMNIAFGRNTKLGCATKKKGNGVEVYCLYDLRPKEGSQIYEAGNGCKSDKDCTTYGNSKCLPSGLCHGVPEPGYKEKKEALENTCGSESETGMTNETRNYLLEIHNKFRSSVAKGLEPDFLGDFTPKAKRMQKLGYDCYLEKIALETITCPPEHQDQSLFFWNMHNVSKPSMSNLDAAKEAVDAWMNEIRQNGLGASNVFLESLYYREAMPFLELYVPIQHYVQMVVDTNDRLGCVIQNCNGQKYVHCFYGFRKSEPMGHAIYEMGQPCTKDKDCTGNVKCLVDEALCESP